MCPRTPNTIRTANMTASNRPIRGVPQRHELRFRVPGAVWSNIWHTALQALSSLTVSCADCPTCAGVIVLSLEIASRAIDVTAQVPSQQDFEVASIKRSEPGNLRGSTFEFLPGGGLLLVQPFQT
jgi:hypothetical protein